MALQTGGSVQFEGYALDTSLWTLRWQEEPIALTRKGLDLLLYLIERRDRVVSRDELISALWPRQVVEISNLTQQIFLLRKALARHPSGTEIIQTVTGRGYRFVAPVETPTSPQGYTDTLVFREEHSVTRVAVEEELSDEPTGEGVESPSATPHRSPTSIRTRRVIAATAVLVVVMVLSALGWRYWRNGQNASDGPPVEVVLADFSDTSGEAGVGTALNDAIRIDLAQSPFATVLPAGKVRATLVTMRKPVDEPVTPALAREVCERNSAQALLQGSLSKFGQRYLASLRASSCLTGDLLAEDKEEVDRPDDLPGAFDRLAAKIRRRLGESRASIQRFDKPLFATHTGSLAALKSYSEGRRLYNRGDWAGALPLFQHALELDPEFATAYLHIASVYYNFRDLDHEREALKKAYALRDALTESSRLYLTAVYHQEVTGDLYASVDTYKTWVALYPNDKGAWGNLASQYDAIGQAALGVEPARRTLAMDPTVDAAYQNLGSVLLHSGQPAAAQQTCEAAIARHLDNERMRDLLLQILYAQHDTPGVTAQLTWAHEHDQPVSLQVDAILVALAAGKTQLASQLIDRLQKADLPPQEQAERTSGILNISRSLADEGLVQSSTTLLASHPDVTPDENALVALVEDGQAPHAEDLLRRIMSEHGHETLWKDLKGPEVQAALLLAQHKPQEALNTLQPTLKFDGLTFGPAYLRGLAYRALGQDDLALTEFQKISARQYIDPLSTQYPLALLEIARTDAHQTNTAKARADYQQFLDLWQSADPDTPLLVAARHEVAQLPRGAP